MRELVLELKLLLEPLQEAAQSLDSLTAFLEELGWGLDAEESDWSSIRGALKFIARIDELIVPINDLSIAETDDEELAAIGQILQIITPMLSELGETVDNAQIPALAPFDNPEFLPRLGEDLYCFLVHRYLEFYHPVFAGLFVFFGIISVSEEEADVHYLRREIDFNRIPQLFNDLHGLLAKEYNWDGGNFQALLFLSRLGKLAQGIGANVLMTIVSDDFANNYYAADSPYRNPVPGLEVSLFQFLISDMGVGGIWLVAAPIPPANQKGAAPEGIVVFPVVEGAAENHFQLTEFLELTLQGQFESAGAVRLEVRPSGVSVSFDEDLGLTVDALAALTYGETAPTVLLGSRSSSNLQIGGAELEAHVTGQVEAPEVAIRLDLNGGKLIVDGGEGDGFLQKLLPPDGIEANFEFGVEWSTTEGLRFRGSAALEVTLPVHISLLDIIKIESIYLSVGFSENGIIIMVGLSVGANLGPIAISIQRIGVQSSLTFPTSGGNLDKANIDIAFLPPTGVGLSVDAEGLIGGGFVKFDTINERYSGTLALAFGEISITAIGLIETKLPDGKKGFSMLVSICVQFDPPINLSYGFTLLGVGGLVGINRTMVTEALQRGIKNRTLDSILFPDPDSVVVNASQIISDMRTVFPPEEGRFVVGPMLKIGWGYPTIITGELGLFIEFPPDPLRIALMGQLNAALPDEEFGILLINLDILGVLDTEKQELTFQASLFDSAMLSYPYVFSITGDAAFLLNWGSTPDFALSVGGFHPKFDPPPPDYIFSDLRRMQMNVTYYGIVNLACKSYLALTPNTLQFGAQVELYVSQAGFDIGGGMGFDALIYFSPFSFEVSICGYVWVKAQGISLMDIYIKADLSGPNPWNVNGEAKVTMLFFDFTADFSITWGDTQKAVIAPQDPLQQLIEALSNPGNWSSRLPYKRSMVETLRSFEEHEDTPDIVIVHPSGRLEIRQNAVPFNITLEKIGNAPVTGHDRFKITGLEAGTQLNPEYVREFFARGQFEELSNAKKLSVPSFEKMDSGVTTAASQAIRFDVDKVEGKELTYEAILLNPDLTAERVGPTGKSNWDHAQKLMAGSAARLSAKKAGSNKRFKDRNMEPKATLHEERYCIVSAIDLVPVALPEDISSKNLFDTRTEADQALNSHCSRTSLDRNEILVIPECEVPASEAIV